MAETATYIVKTEKFEGPFYLLLSLIRERKLSINDLSLAEVAEDYLRHLKELEERSRTGTDGLPELSAFIAVAATLILLKSKSLLPEFDVSAEEEGSIHDLKNRLQLYELYSRLSEWIKRSFGGRVIFLPEERRPGLPIFAPDAGITKEAMALYAAEVLGRMPKSSSFTEVEVKRVISLEEMMLRLSERVEKAVEASFHELFLEKNRDLSLPMNREEKLVVIVGFLAMLEMARQGILHAAQESHFGDIIIKKNEQDLRTSLPPSGF